MRLFCTGRVVEYTSGSFAGLVRRFGGGTETETYPGARSVILLDIWKVQTSCGFAVPLFGRGFDDSWKDAERDAEKRDVEVFMSDATPALYDRDTLTSFAVKFEAQGKMLEYRAKNNSRSLDGLPGLRAARRDKGERVWLEGLEKVWRRLVAQREGVLLGFLLALGFVLLGNFIRGGQDGILLA